MKIISVGFVWKIRLSLRAEGDKLRAEGNKLRAEGDKFWAEAVIEAYGNVTIEWHSHTKCTVDGIDTFDDSI